VQVVGSFHRQILCVLRAVFTLMINTDLMFIIPHYAATVSAKINIEITLTCFGVNTQSSGCLQVVMSEVTNH